jgi:hypothetical protein
MAFPVPHPKIKYQLLPSPIENEQILIQFISNYRSTVHVPADADAALASLQPMW